MVNAVQAHKSACSLSCPLLNYEVHLTLHGLTGKIAEGIDGAATPLSAHQDRAACAHWHRSGAGLSLQSDACAATSWRSFALRSQTDCAQRVIARIELHADA